MFGRCVSALDDWLYGCVLLHDTKEHQLNAFPSYCVRVGMIRYEVNGRTSYSDLIPIRYTIRIELQFNILIVAKRANQTQNIYWNHNIHKTRTKWNPIWYDFMCINAYIITFRISIKFRICVSFSQKHSLSESVSWCTHHHHHDHSPINCT